MSYLRSYKRLNTLIRNESFEPLISWGLRMALSGTLPVIWGLATGKLNDAVWMTLTAEAVCWVELKGSFTWRARTLLTGALLAILFSTLGTVTGFNIWLGMAGMFVAGYLATLLKNIGDRASGLAICVYMLYIISNAFPVKGWQGIEHRMLLLAIGAGWPVVVGVAASLIMPAQEPYRRQIALIWRAIAELVATIATGGAGKSRQEFTEEILVKEKDVRAATNNSFQFYARMAHQVNKDDNRQYQLAQLRKTAGLVAVNMTAIGDEMSYIAIPDLDEALRVKATALFSALREAVTRISAFVITLKPEEKLLALSHINRLKKLIALIRQYPLPADAMQTSAIKRILQLTERTIRLLENAIQKVEQMGTDIPVYRSYSFLKTVFILRPKHLFSSLRILFNSGSMTTRYALRSAIAATLALFIYQWFHIDHGYWLPFSVMIVIQPYFGATYKRARERVTGTVLGGLTGSLLLRLPAGLHIKEGILFLTFILMVYYVKKHYAIAVFIITLNLVLLFNIESAYNDKLMLTRAICTIGGSLLAVLSGLALLPTWDKKWLPAHLADAVYSNYEYFLSTFYTTQRTTNWTRYKRIVESKNSNVYDSFNRYLEEPGREKTMVYYDLATYNVRITRDLNNIHLEQDEKRAAPAATAIPAHQERIDECMELFNDIIQHMPGLNPDINVKINVPGQLPAPFALNEVQLISLEKIIIELKAIQEDMEQLLHTPAA